MKRSTLQRMLFTIPPQIMSHNELSELAFNFNHYKDPSEWFISDDILTVKLGESVKHFDLTILTINDLIAELNANGFIVENINNEILNYPAISLSESNSGKSGSGLSKINSILLVMLKSYSRELRRLRNSIPEAIKQLIIPESEGYWLDRWGSIYGINKPTYLTDSQYAKYIPDEAFRVRVNAIAIEKAVKDITGYDIIITEPWANVFTLDISKLSSKAKFQDGISIGYCLIKPISYDYVPWHEIIPIIMRNKAGGVIMLDPEILYKIGAVEVYEAKAFLGVRENIPSSVRFYENPNILDLMRLSVKSYQLYAWSLPTSFYVTLPLLVYNAAAWFSRSDIMSWLTDNKVKLINAYRTDVAYCSGIDYLTWSQIDVAWKDIHRNWGSGELATKIIYSIKDTWVTERYSINPLVFDIKPSLFLENKRVINANCYEAKALSYQSNQYITSAKNEFSLFSSFSESYGSYSLSLLPAVKSTHTIQITSSTVLMPRISAALSFSDSIGAIYAFNETKANLHGNSSSSNKIDINQNKATLFFTERTSSTNNISAVKAMLKMDSSLAERIDFQFININGRSENILTRVPELSISAKCLYNYISMVSRIFEIGIPKSFNESKFSSNENYQMKVLATRSVAVSAEGSIYAWNTPDIKWGDFSWIDKTLPPFDLS